MAEKKLIVDAIRFTYSGMFDIDLMFKELTDWEQENGFEREVKRKLEHVHPDSKDLSYTFELWKQPTNYNRVTVRIKILCKDVVDFDLKRKDHTVPMQKGQVIVIIDGFLESQVTRSRWWNKPWYMVFRSIVEKQFWRYWWGKYDPQVANASYSLLKRMQSFFKRYKY